MSKAIAIANDKEIKSLNKYYNIAKVLLTLTPFVCLMYLSMGSASVGVSIAETMQEDPKFTIMFLVSMINPFIAYLLMFMHKKINSNDVGYAVTNLVMFIIAEILLQNVLYAILFAFILYKTLKIFKVTIIGSFKEKIKERFLMTISGSIVVIVLASICLFATIRINM